MVYDSTFVTPEGIRVRMPIGIAAEIAGSDIKMKRWPQMYTQYYVALPSGWYATIQCNDPPSPGDPIDRLTKSVEYIED